MPSRLLSTLLFLSSYAPVFGLLALTSYDESCEVFVGSLVLLAASAIGVAVFLITAKRKPAIDMTIISVETRDADLAGYLVGYLLPFIGVADESWRDFLAMGLLFVLIGIVYVNSRMVYINPILAVFGYHVHLVRASTAPDGARGQGQPQYFVSRRSWLAPNDHLTARRVMANALFAFREDDDDASQR